MNNDEIDLLANVGGRPMMMGGESVWDFGLRPSPEQVTAEVTTAFMEEEDVPELTGDRVELWKYAQAVNGGKHPSYNWQLTGSCVNGGLYNVLLCRTGIECANLAEPESFRYPFTLAAYGYSRYLLGDNSPGEGSSGDTMAKAVRDMGVTDGADPEVPKARFLGPASCYTAAEEMQWSAHRNCPPGVKERSKAHTAEFVVVKTLDQAEKELRRLRPITIAGNWGGGLACTYRGTGENRILWNGDRKDTWNHQQALIGCRIHPEFGRIWYWLNQWYQLVNGVAVSLHGTPANGEPPGGYWTDDRAVQHQLSYRFGELRAFKGFRGFPGILDFGSI